MGRWLPPLVGLCMGASRNVPWTGVCAPCLVAGVTPDHRRARLAGFVLGTCAAACWGLAPVATKGALAGFSPEMIGVTRLGVAALVFRALRGGGTRRGARGGVGVLAREGRRDASRSGGARLPGTRRARDALGAARRLVLARRRGARRRLPLLQLRPAPHPPPPPPPSRARLMILGQAANGTRARWVRGEPLTARRLVGSALTVAGVVIVN